MRTRPRLLIVPALVVALVGLQPGGADAATSVTRSLSATSSTSSPTAGSTFKISGRLTKSPKGSSIQIQRRTGTSSSWVKVASLTTTSSAGYYSKSLKLTAVGRYYFRAYSPRKGSLKAATSPARLVRSKVTIATASLPSGSVNVPYTAQLAKSPSGTAGTWTAVELPDGLSVSPGGSISGIPTSAADAAPTVTFTPSTGGRSSAKALGLTIGPATVPVITTTSLPDGTIGTPYAMQVRADQPGTWSLADGTTPPDGITFDDGVFSGTPVAAADTSVRLQLANANGTVTKDLTIHVDPAATTPTRSTIIDAGGAHACRVKADHTLWCWGLGDKGQLGIGQMDLAPDKPNYIKQYKPRQVGSEATWAQVSTGSDDVQPYTCATKIDRTLWCWGSSSDGQLGNKDAGGAWQTEPVQIATDHNWSQVSIGSAHACAITTSDALWCWGGRVVGNPTATDTSVPVPVGTSHAWKAVSAGGGHTCAITTTDELWCWGYNSRGQVGDGSGTSQDLPVRIGTAGDWESIESGPAQSCGIRSGGSLWCWGASLDGRVGSGATTDVMQPTQVAAGTTWAAVSTGGAGNFGQTCGLSTGGELWCWGYNGNGQLGNGSVDSSATPVRAGSDADWQSVSVGGTFSCGVKTTGAQLCWGNNADGAVGSNTQVATFTTPYAVFG